MFSRSLIRVVIGFPFKSYIFKDTNPTCGVENEMGVIGLKRLG